MQFLTWKGEELDGETKIEQLGLGCYGCNPERIKLSIDWPKVFSVLFKTQNGKTFDLYIQREQTVKEIKTKIHNSKGFLPDEMKMRFAGQELENGKTFTHQNIFPNSTVNLIFGPNIKVEIKTVDQGNISLLVKHRETIGFLKQLISSQTNISVQHQRLSINGKEFNDNISLDQIEAQGLLVFKLSVKKVPKTEFYIRNQRNQVFSVIVSLESDLNALKQAIKVQTRIDEEEQVLTFKGVELTGVKSLQEFGIEELSVVDLEVRSQERIKVEVETQNGRKISLSIDPGCLTEELKAKVAEKEKINIEQFELFFEGQELEEGMRIADYDIGHLSVLQMGR